MDQVFQALIDRSRVLLDLKTIKTILGYKHRPKFRKRKKSAEWEVAVEKPTYDLIIFKLHCDKLTLKIYTKGERVLRIEVVVHNTEQLRCGRSLEKFPEIVVQAKGILERFMDALSCIDQCFIADRMLEQLPAPSQVGKTKVGGIDLNKARMRWVTEAIIALSPSPGGFTASQLADQVRTLGKQSASQYDARRAAYDLKKLRGNKIVRRIGKTRRYESLPKGLRAMAGPQKQSHQTLASGCTGTMAFTWCAESKGTRCALPDHSQCHAGCFPGTRVGRVNIDNYFVGLRP